MTKLLKKSAIVAAVTLACAGGAQAVSYSWGPHGPAESSLAVGGGLVPVGAFSDTYSFEFTSALPAFLSSSVVVANNLALPPPFGSIFNITGGVYELFSNGSNTVVGGGDDVSIASWLFNGTTGSTANTTGALANGYYHFAVTGIATGGFGGSYMINSAVSPVPEPETYAMLLAGLGMIGFTARRRKTGV